METNKDAKHVKNLIHGQKIGNTCKRGKKGYESVLVKLIEKFVEKCLKCVTIIELYNIPRPKSNWYKSFNEKRFSTVFQKFQLLKICGRKGMFFKDTCECFLMTKVYKPKPAEQKK